GGGGVRRAPPPGPPQLADLPLLVQRATESGLRAHLQVAGDPYHPGAEVELAGYRVVQESLTNTIRYAPGAATTVRVAYRADGIVVDVVDDGPGPLTTAVPAAQGGGTGLAGLSERSRLLGGHLAAGGGGGCGDDARDPARPRRRGRCCRRPGGRVDGGEVAPGRRRDGHPDAATDRH